MGQKGDTQRLDLENAVLMQELMALKVRYSEIPFLGISVKSVYEVLTLVSLFNLYSFFLFIIFYMFYINFPKVILIILLSIKKSKKKGKFLYSAVSSPQDRSKRFTLYFPDRPVHSDTISASLGSIQPYAAINARRLLIHIFTTVYSQVLI